MPDPDTRLTDLEIALTHQERLTEELNDVVREQANRLDHLERQVAALIARLAALAADDDEPPPADVRPPHW